MTVRYIVATDKFVYSGHQEAKLYKLTGYQNRAILAGTGSVAQMQELADQLNKETS